MDTVLERMPQIAIDENEEDFAEEVNQLLGYKTLMLHKASERDISLLQELQLNPFTRESVNKYKEKKQQEYNAERIKKLKHVPFGLGRKWFIAAGVIFILSVILSNLFYGSIMFYGLVLTLAMIISGLFKCSEFTKENPSYQWNVYQLSNYTEKVPINILETALILKKKFPDAVFMVDVFEKDVDKNRLIGDPFLIMYLNGYHYYLEAWKEPAYHAQSVNNKIAILDGRLTWI